MQGGNIVRKIGGESIKRAKESITLTANGGNLTFNARKQVTMVGRNGGVQYLNDYTPPPPLRVVKLDGPFDEKGQKVSSIKKGISYQYKIVNFNRQPKPHELIRIKWATQFDEGEIISKYPQNNGKQEVKFWVPRDVKNSKFSVYAYLEKPSKDVSIEIDLFEVKFPILIIQSIGRKGKKTIVINNKKTSSKQTADDLLYNDYTEDEAGYRKLRNQLRQETYNVHKQDGRFDIISRNNYADNKADKLIKKVKKFSKKTDIELFKIFENNATIIFSMGNLKDNIKRMILKMKNNEGGEYSHIDLTNAVIEHENTIKFINNVKKWTVSYLKLEKFKNNPEDLRVIGDSEGIIYNSSFSSKVGKPRFNNNFDKFSGIQIAINDVWAYKIYLSKYYLNNNEPHGELLFEMFDHFGLDYPDIEKYDNDIFIAWFILQHFRGYKPFITKISFTSKF